MTTPVPDLAATRLANTLALFDEFVRASARHADAATLRGLERRFAERLQILPSYWSQIKARSRQIGERLARQFEAAFHKPVGWLDQPHGAATQAAATADAATSSPQDDDERFMVGLVLTYYRRHPQRARERLLHLLGEVLAPASAPMPASASAAAPSPQAPAAARRDWADQVQGVTPLGGARAGKRR